MRREEIEALVTGLAQEACASLGLLFVDANYRKSNGIWRILVRIDRPEGVSIDDCAEVSRTLGAKLDEADPIEHEYTLEVSSAGLSDPLKTEADFVRFTGRMIEVELDGARAAGRGRTGGNELVTGRLLAHDQGMLQVETDEGPRHIARGSIKRVRPAVDFKGAGAKGQ